MGRTILSFFEVVILERIPIENGTFEFGFLNIVRTAMGAHQ